MYRCIQYIVNILKQMDHAAYLQMYTAHAESVPIYTVDFKSPELNAVHHKHAEVYPVDCR